MKFELGRLRLQEETVGSAKFAGKPACDIRCDIRWDVLWDRATKKGCCYHTSQTHLLPGLQNVPDGIEQSVSS
jgi:hypothetical protein